MSLIELKQQAKVRKIKQYYIMKRAQLIQLLEMEELPHSLVIEKMTIAQLREQAKLKGMRGFWALRREALVELLFPEDVDKAATDKNEKNHSKTDEHNNPQNHHAKDVRVEDVEDADHQRL